MTSHLAETPFFQPDPLEDSSDKFGDLSISIKSFDGQQSGRAESKEIANDEVQSFVIVNDIDVDEEINKAQMDNKSFKVLSMSFYGQLKAHHLDAQDSRYLVSKLSFLFILKGYCQIPYYTSRWRKFDISKKAECSYSSRE